MTKAYHLYHSGVAVEDEGSLYVFDYYNDVPEGETRSLENGVITRDLLARMEEVYVFVSHSHGDHYDPVIFTWEEAQPNISYVISYDVLSREKGENYNFVKPDQTLKIGDICIETFDSTDRGVSFLVDTENLQLFHAGDLNWWHWPDNSAEQQQREEEEFKKEIDKIKDRDLDLAFVPVDPRLGQYYYLAGEYFARIVQPRVLVPIHFGDKFEITGKFAERMKDKDLRVVEIYRRGQKIEL